MGYHIITGQYIAYGKHCRFRFGYYVEAHEDCKFSNDIEEQTVICIYLGFTAKFQESYKMFPLKTGARGYT